MPSHASDRSASLGTRFLECLSRHPQSAALFFEERMLTCGELAQQSAAFAGALRRRGIQAGDRVALLLPNVPEFIPAYVGILCAGAIAVPLDPTSRPPEIRQILLDAEVTAAVVWSKSWPLVHRPNNAHRPGHAELQRDWRQRSPRRTAGGDPADRSRNPRSRPG